MLTVAFKAGESTPEGVVSHTRQADLMVPQKTGVSSDFSRTLSHLQRINYSKAVNEDQVPVSQPKKGTAVGLLLATCCLPGIYGRVLWLQGH